MSFNGRSSANVCVVLLHPLGTTSQSKYLHSDPGGCHCLCCLGASMETPKRILCWVTIGTWCFEKGCPKCPCCFDWPPSSDTSCCCAKWFKHLWVVRYINDLCTLGVVYLWASNCSSFSCTSHPSGKVAYLGLACIVSLTYRYCSICAVFCSAHSKTLGTKIQNTSKRKPCWAQLLSLFQVPQSIVSLWGSWAGRCKQPNRAPLASWY